MRTITILILITLVCVLSCSTMSFAQTRTTPVEVENTPTVKIDGTANTVKVDPSGNTVKIDPTGNTVQVSGTPSVNVVNTPTVSVGNSPVIKMDTTQNIVKTPTQNNLIQLWAGTQTVAGNGGIISSSLMNCSGYKEARLVIVGQSIYSEPEKIRIRVRFSSPAGTSPLIGYGNFAAPTTPPILNANFVQPNNIVTMIIPILSNYVVIDIENTRTSDIMISASSWIYLVN